MCERCQVHLCYQDAQSPRSSESYNLCMAGLQGYHHQLPYLLPLHYITLHYVTLRYVTLRYVTLRYVTLRYVTLRYVTLRYVTLRYVTLRHVNHVTSRHISLHHLITSHYITSHHITSHHITSHHITSHHITSHYITLHYITLHSPACRSYTDAGSRLRLQAIVNRLRRFGLLPHEFPTHEELCEHLCGELFRQVHAPQQIPRLIPTSSLCERELHMSYDLYQSCPRVTFRDPTRPDLRVHPTRGQL